MFEITADIDRAERLLTDIGRNQLPFALAMALNDTGESVLRATELEIARVFDRPVRFTKKAFFLRRARKTNLHATVERKLPQRGRHYLEVQSEGGPRPQTALEKLMSRRVAYSGNLRSVLPAKGARLTAAGNWSPGQRNQVLSGLKAQRDVLSNTTRRSAARNKKKRGSFFVPKEGSKLSPGVWERRGKTGIRKIVHFSDRVPTYDKRFEFEPLAARRARMVFKDRFYARFSEAMRTAKKR